MKNLDIATIGGFIAGIFFVVTAILQKGSLLTFFDPSSIMITIGGTFAATMISYPLNDFY